MFHLLGSATIVAEQDLFNLLTIIDGAAPKWKTVGIFLGILNSELATIEQKPLLISEGSTGYFREMLSQWLEHGPPKHDWPSIESLVSALRNVGEERAARDLQEKYLLKSGRCMSLSYTMHGHDATIPCHNIVLFRL